MLTKFLGLDSAIQMAVLAVVGGVFALMLLGHAALGFGFWMRGKELANVRGELSLLQAKNARCETEAAGLKGSLATQTKAVTAIKDESDKRVAESQAAAKAAEIAARRQYAGAKAIMDAPAAFPDDLCRSADKVMTDFLKARK